MLCDRYIVSADKQHCQQPCWGCWGSLRVQSAGWSRLESEDAEECAAVCSVALQDDGPFCSHPGLPGLPAAASRWDGYLGSQSAASKWKP